MAAQSFVTPGVVVLAAGLLGATGCEPKNPKALETPPAAVLVSRPLERRVTDYQVFTARTEAKESVDLKARVTGHLSKILYKDGDNVKEGVVLFQIDDRPYKAALDQAKAGLAHAKASLDVANAAKAKAQAEYDIGLNVRKEQPGAISEQEIARRLGARDEAKANIDVATAAIGEAQAALELAQQN
jgi:multidrug efflux pump subunit AcrA (membrane-fusion protein)